MQTTVSDRDPTRHAVHANTGWRAAIWAGLIAGVVFLVLEMLLVWMLQGMSPWAPPRMIAAMVLGPEVLPTPHALSLTATMAAMLIHFPLSIVYGLVVGWAIHLVMGMALLVGAAFGLSAVYAVNFYRIADGLPLVRRRAEPGERRGARHIRRGPGGHLCRHETRQVIVRLRHGGTVTPHVRHA